MTPEQRAALITAIDIARAGAEPPIRTYATLIPARLIEQLRRDLEACGIDWARRDWGTSQEASA